MPRPQNYKEIDQYKQQLTVEKIASYASKTNETIAALNSYSAEYKRHKKELYSLVAEATAHMEKAMELLADPNVTDADRKQLANAIKEMHALQGLELKRDKFFDKMLDITLNQSMRSRFRDAIVDIDFFQNNLVQGGIVKDGNMLVSRVESLLSQARKCAILVSGRKCTERVADIILNLKHDNETFAQYASKHPKKVEFKLPEMSKSGSIQQLAHRKYFTALYPSTEKKWKAKYSEFANVYLESKKYITLAEADKNTKLVDEYSNFILTRNLRDAHINIFNINPSLLNRKAFTKIRNYYGAKNTAKYILPNMKIEHLNAWVVHRGYEIHVYQWIAQTKLLSAKEKANVLQTLLKQYEERGQLSEFMQPLQKFLYQAIRHNVATQEDIQKAIDLKIVNVEMLKKWVTQGLLNAELLMLPIQHIGLEMTLAHYCIAENVRVKYGDNVIHTVFLSEYLDTHKVLKIDEDKNFRDRDVELKHKVISKAKEDGHIHPNFLNRLKVVVKVGIRHDITEKDPVKRKRTVLNHLYNDDPIIYQAVMEVVGEKQFAKLANRLNSQQIEFMLKNGIKISPKGTSPLLLIKGVNLERMKDFDINILANALQTNKVDEYGITVLEYMHKHNITFGEPNLGTLNSAKEKLNIAKHQLQEVSGLEKVQLEEKIAKLKVKIEKISVSCAPYLHSSPLEAILSLPAKDIDTKALANSGISAYDIAQFATKENQAIIAQILTTRIEENPERANEIRDDLVAAHHNCKNKEQAVLIQSIHEKCQTAVRGDKARYEAKHQSASKVLVHVLKYCKDNPRKTRIVIEQATKGKISATKDSYASKLTEGEISAAVRELNCEQQSEILDSLKFLSPSSKEFNRSFIQRVLVKIEIFFTGLYYGKEQIVADFEQEIKNIETKEQIEFKEAANTLTENIKPEIITAGAKAIAGLMAELEIKSEVQHEIR